MHNDSRIGPGGTRSRRKIINNLTCGELKKLCKTDINITNKD